MKKEKIPLMNEYDKFDRLATSSQTECTGLITVPPQDSDELENYRNLYDFGPGNENDKSRTFE